MQNTLTVSGKMQIQNRCNSIKLGTLEGRVHYDIVNKNETPPLSASTAAIWIKRYPIQYYTFEHGILKLPVRIGRSSNLGRFRTRKGRRNVRGLERNSNLGSLKIQHSICIEGFQSIHRIMDCPYPRIWKTSLRVFATTCRATRDSTSQQWRNHDGLTLTII